MGSENQYFAQRLSSIPAYLLILNTNSREEGPWRISSISKPAQLRQPARSRSRQERTRTRDCSLGLRNSMFKSVRERTMANSFLLLVDQRPLTMSPHKIIPSPSCKGRYKPPTYELNLHHAFDLEPPTNNLIAPTHALLRTPRHRQNLHDPRPRQIPLRTTTLPLAHPRTQRIRRTRHLHRPRENQGLCARPALSPACQRPFVPREILLSPVQDHHPGRSGLDDAGRAVGAQTHDGEILAHHALLPGVQLRDEDHRPACQPV